MAQCSSVVKWGHSNVDITLVDPRIFFIKTLDEEFTDLQKINLQQIHMHAIAPLSDLLVNPWLIKSKSFLLRWGQNPHHQRWEEFQFNALPTELPRHNAWRSNYFNIYTDTYISNHFSPLFDISGNKAFMERPISTLL